MLHPWRINAVTAHEYMTSQPRPPGLSRVISPPPPPSQGLLGQANHTTFQPAMKTAGSHGVVRVSTRTEMYPREDFASSSRRTPSLKAYKVHWMESRINDF